MGPTATQGRESLPSLSKITSPLCYGGIVMPGESEFFKVLTQISFAQFT